MFCIHHRPVPSLVSSPQPHPPPLLCLCFGPCFDIERHCRMGWRLDLRLLPAPPLVSAQRWLSFCMRFPMRLVCFLFARRERGAPTSTRARKHRTHQCANTAHTSVQTHAHTLSLSLTLSLLVARFANSQHDRRLCGAARLWVLCVQGAAVQLHLVTDSHCGWHHWCGSVNDR